MWRRKRTLPDLDQEIREHIEMATKDHLSSECRRRGLRFCTPDGPRLARSIGLSGTRYRIEERSS
jgi:hypothetical protein